MKLGKYVPVFLALSISMTLIVVTAISIHLIYNYDRANVSHHLLTRLQAANGMLDMWQHNYLTGVEAVAGEPGLIKLVDDLINNRISNEDANNALEQWLRPIYLGRGYDGHSVISPDYQILLSSSPAYTGKTAVLGTTREAISNAFAKGSAISRPIESPLPFSLLNKTAPPGSLFQLGCARISKAGKTLAILCLRQDPNHNFFAMMRAGFSGTSGESYAVNREGQIISPTRFGKAFVEHQTADAKEPSYVKGLFARVPTKTKNGVLVTNPKTSPLTQAIKLAQENGESGFIDRYLDYRGVEVVGAAQWLPDMDIGIVVEQDAREVYTPFQFSTNAIIAFTLLTIVLINILVVVMARGRKSLAEREERMRAFLDNFPGLAHMRDVEGRFLVANKHLEGFMNVPRNKIIGDNGDNLFRTPHHYLKQLNAEHYEVIRTGRVVETIKELAGFSYNNMQWMKITRFPIFDPETREVYAVGTILIDISEQTRNAQELESIRLNLEKIVAQRTAQLENAKHEAESAARAKSDFLANMSHEIRTPMNAIVGLSHLATLVSDDPKLRNYLERIHQSSTHLLSIVNDILDFSKIEAGHMTIEQADFSLEEVLDHALGLLWERAHAKGLELLVDMDLNLPHKLKGDALRIGQVLINFTSNAVKFTEQGTIVVSVTKVHEDKKNIRVRFSVKDTGIGIADEQLEQLFKPFQQLDNSSTRRFEGTGLGLTISRNLVELMGGQLDFTSEPGVGSTFYFELDLGKSGNSDHTKPIALTQGKRVLVLNQKSQSREILCNMLNALAMNITTAESIEAAANTINNTDAFDVILIDWQTPSTSGIEAVNQLKEVANTRTAQFLLLCGHNKHHLANTAEDLFAAIITKPLFMSSLQDALIELFKPNPIRTHQPQPFDVTHYQQLENSRILLVDDNSLNQDVVLELLKLVTAQVITASNGKEAIDLLERQDVDAVLMDVQMPIMDGIEATRHLRTQEKFAQLPIIAMTAGALMGDRERCLTAGMNDYISKPIYPDILFQILLRWLSPQSDAIEYKDTPILVEKPKTNELVAPLYKIDGLEVDEALERLLHNEILYVTLIKRFIQERENVVNQMEAALAANKIDELSHAAHSFKSLAGTIGATQLQSLALEIEIHLSQQQDVTQLLQQLRAALEKLIGKLRLALKLNEKAI